MDIIKKAESTNEKLWDEIAPVHYKSYDLDRIRKGGNNLDPVELEEVGSVKNKSLLHLQCHLGHDSVCWAKEGAQVTAVDFSLESIKIAKQFSQEVDIEVEYIHSNVYDLSDKLDKQFDIVYTSRGVLCWLKDIDEWGRIISRYLKPGGTFYIMESHPLTYIFDENSKESFTAVNNYFHEVDPVLWDDDGPDYADENYSPKTPSYEWQWSMGDIVNALIKAGLNIDFLHEFDWIFDRRFPALIEKNDRFYLNKEKFIPLVFSIKATKTK